MLEIMGILLCHYYYRIHTVWIEQLFSTHNEKTIFFLLVSCHYRNTRFCIQKIIFWENISHSKNLFMRVPNEKTFMLCNCHSISIALCSLSIRVFVNLFCSLKLAICIFTEFLKAHNFRFEMIFMFAAYTLCITSYVTFPIL